MTTRPNSVEAMFMASAIAGSLSKTQRRTKTNKKMHTTFNALAAHAKAKSYGKISPATVTAKQLRNFITERLKQVDVRTVENEATHLRHALKGAGREDLASQLTRKDLGIPPATRIGKRKETDPIVLASALERASHEENIWINLQQYAGLRQDEMLQSHKTVTLMLADLERGASHITIREGTKGGRLRDTLIPPDYREPLKAALLDAKGILAGRKYLVDSVNGEAAARLVHRHYQKLGLAKENSSHSLRAGFAVHSYRHYLSLGMTKREALMNLANDMGHGDGRGRWLWNNYLRPTLEGK